MLETISGKYTIKQIFKENWEWFYSKHKDHIRESVLKEVEKILACKDKDKLGWSLYECNECGHKHYAPHTCKSGFCNSCGKIMTDNWIKKMQKEFLEGGIGKESSVWKDCGYFPHQVLKERFKYHLIKDLEEFISRLIRHIPEKNFRMIRHYGFYANCVKNKLTPLLKLQISLLFSAARLVFSPNDQLGNWRERIERLTGSDPLVCPNCKMEIKLVEIAYRTRDGTLRTINISC